MAPAHATVVSIFAKLRIPATSCLTTCAFAAAAIRPTTVNTASVGTAGCMRAPPRSALRGLLSLRRFFLEQRLAAQTDLAGRVDVDHLHEQLLAFLQLVAHVLHAMV